ncbi:transcriptional regulator [Sphingomonas gei]|uniref:Transcriptional regulator n=1 Tax=Sphingomonas gei TaxID=1395960 RepID=A0A4S1XE92_9SPHN|nr:helix-turn-helix transcriptional regulator [Sphingomonas gei]TGX53953.1 transcriptional regulator [Sphingomonas gei]
MDANAAVIALSALAHPGRLDIFRLLVRAGEEGMASGEIARATGHVPQTLSGNLTILGHAGLVTSRREGRSIIYTAAYNHMTSLLGFLMEDCCAGKPEICAPLADIVTQAACCQPGPLQ